MHASARGEVSHLAFQAEGHYCFNSGTLPRCTVLYLAHYTLAYPALSAMLWTMSLRRPSRPLAAPSWILLHVLDSLEGLPAYVAHDNALARATSLMPLCTGWRISELQACVRLSDYCLITQDGGLRIRPHMAFLA